MLDSKIVKMTEPTLRVITQLLNANGEISGSDILNMGGIFSGTLYPILRRLEGAGWIEGRWENIDPTKERRPRRRFYRLTALGQSSGESALVKRQTMSWNNGLVPA